MKIGLFFLFFFYFAMNFGNIPQTSEFRVQTSDFGLLTSDFGLRTSDFGLRTSDFGLRASGFGLRTSGFGLRASDFGLRTSDFGRGTSDVGFNLGFLRNLNGSSEEKRVCPLCRKEIKIGLFFLFSFYFAMNFRNIPQTSDFRVQTEFSFILQ